MPTYQIDIPNQGTFEVSSDVELSEADVYKHALSQIDQEKPSEGLSAGDVAYGAVTNMPSSLAGVASDIFTAITNPLEQTNLKRPACRLKAFLPSCELVKIISGTISPVIGIFSFLNLNICLVNISPPVLDFL